MTNREETNQFTNRGNKKLLQIIQYKKPPKMWASCRELPELEKKDETACAVLERGKLKPV